MRNGLRCLLAICLLTCVLSYSLGAQTVSPALFNGMSWRSIGPFRGGRAVAVSGVPGGGSTFYFGAVDGGVWKTTDAGSTWTPLFDDQPVASVGAIAVAPSEPSVIYVGTGESDIRSNLASGDGVYKSTDSGKTWQNIGLKDTRQISRIFVSAKDPNLVFVAALGHAYGPNEERGVFRSADGGKSWTKVLYRGPKIGAADLAMSPDNPQVLFASLWEAHRPPWSSYPPLAGPGSGLFRSKDGGSTWQELKGNGLPEGPLGRAGVAIAAGTHGSRVYAAIEAKEAGLYRSDDGGDTWRRVNKDPRITSRAWYFSCVTVDPNDPDTVYVPNVATYKLTGGGKDLSILRGAPGGDDYHQLWIDPANSLHMVLGVDQGTTVTLNGGVTWSTWYNQPTAQFYHVVVDNQFPYHVYGAQQDSGTAAIASRTDHGQIDTRDWFTVGGSESGYIALDSKDPNVIYASGTYGSLYRFDRRTMQSQNIAPSPLPGGLAESISERKYRDPWTPVLVASPAQPQALYYGTQYVMKTLDGGLHWQTISKDLTGSKRERESKPEGPVTVENAKDRGFGVVYSIAPSPLSAGEIWAGSDTGLVHLTRDNGGSWSDVTPPPVESWSKITQIEASHFSPAVAYVAVDRHRLDDRHPYLFRTRDFGKTWQSITTGIAESSFLNVVREDPKHKGLLFAGTEFGVYVSFDDGDHWQPFQLNLPVTSVRDLNIHDDDLVVATHGRGFWILDNISPLRQISDHQDSTAAILFKPARAVRSSSDRFPGTPLPPEEPQAQNPPAGTYIDYYLPGAAGSEVVLELVDLQGNTIRRYGSRDRFPKAGSDVPIAPRWLPTPALLSEQAGMHRFVWDLRYGRAGEPTTGDPDETGVEHWIGPLVLPGSYRAKLTVDGRTFSQPVQVAMDPRTQASPAELAEQFRWSQRVFEDMATTRKAIAEINRAKRELTRAESRSGQDGQSAFHASISAAGKSVQDILDGSGSEKNSGLEAVNRQLTIALTSIDGADRTPPSQVIALSQESARALKACLTKWSAYKRTSLPGLNNQLRGAGLEAIDIGDTSSAARNY